MKGEFPNKSFVVIGAYMIVRLKLLQIKEVRLLCILQPTCIMFVFIKQKNINSLKRTTVYSLELSATKNKQKLLSIISSIITIMLSEHFYV